MNDQNKLIAALNANTRALKDVLSALKISEKQLSRRRLVEPAAEGDWALGDVDNDKVGED